MNQIQPKGLVVLVGAGPGPSKMITAEGASWISRADMVVYDRLANADLLDLARSDAERISVAKTPGRPGPTQEEINALLIDACRMGKLVVRLKGGDPLLFGRGGEEADALAAAGCSFRITPGVTAAVAAAAYAAIPLTDRRLASTVALVAGHEDPAKEESSICWPALAQIDTVVFYMGVRNLPVIVERLIAAGRAGTTPVAIVENAATPSQRTIVAALETIVDRARESAISPPALIIVGEVVSLRERISWWEKLPLSGRTVLVTRARGQAMELAGALRQLGANVIEAPTIRIERPGDYRPLDAALKDVRPGDWLVLTSPNGATAVLARMEQLGMDARSLGDVRIAAVGPATAAVLKEHFLRADLLPETFTTAALGDMLIERTAPAGKRYILARADIASPQLADALRNAGAIVEEVTAYRTIRPDELPAPAVEALQAGTVDWITFTSPATVSNFLAMIDRDRMDLSTVRTAAIGPVTADRMRAEGLAPSIVAEPHTIEAMVCAIAEFGR